MPQKTVVDSSVIVKWLNTDNEQYLEQADKILKEARDGKVEIIAPELSKYEVGNVLLFGKKLTSEQANIPLYWLFHLPVTFISLSEELSKKTFSIAELLKITYYDAAFLALAELENAVLITDNFKHQGKSSAVKVIALKDY
ncbi:MAG: type II toxin-antitoxin system VapC family toxin [Candidatus Daviesbacteria bacterium]|nr:type II toxin-antitoxin system VapC family toxin [Candidatus Daviesbacteria bacterium]